MINAEAVSTIDDTKMNDNDSSNVILMVDSTADDTKKSNNDSNNVVSMIDADAASTLNDDDLKSY